MNLRQATTDTTDSTADAGSGRGSGPQTTLTSGPSGLVGLVRRILQVEALPVLIATLILVAVIGALQPRFLSFANLHDVLQQSVYVAILAAGLAFLIGMREIDLSVGSVFGLSLIIGALLMKHGMNPWLAVTIAVALGGVMGLMNATLVQVIAIPAIVATLATLSMFRGLALALTDGQQVTGLPVNSAFFSVVGGHVHIIPVSLVETIRVWLLLAAMLTLSAS